MQQPLIASGRVESGELHIRSRKKFDASLKRWRDCEVTVTVERMHATRSAAQNRYLWGGVYDAISEHTGYDPEEVHALMKQLHLPRHRAVCDKNGEVKGDFVIGGSTARLNKIEFGEYIERVRRWAAETLGLDIPDPVEQW